MILGQYIGIYSFMYNCGHKKNKIATNLYEKPLSDSRIIFLVSRLRAYVKNTLHAHTYEDAKIHPIYYRSCEKFIYEAAKISPLYIIEATKIHRC